ncbi:hypothetical protein SPI_03213 [Niveomyces insectorum RCEF 264]|uniref:Uncharacterized protein n=1 Tax=Niveomyces insectorum RCEF 264 TaxID=1081102 RepID=A0A167X5V3_9HYPO|nr:hypothetical protein SPI_03213 [Niveomyces insectorum RCEF 264]
MGKPSKERLYAGSEPATFFVRYGYTFYAYNDDIRGASYAFSSAPDGGPPSSYYRASRERRLLVSGRDTVDPAARLLRFEPGNRLYDI